MFHLLVFTVLFIISLCFYHRQGYAASFQANEQSATYLGMGNAGTGVGDDPSIAWFNPAGMVQFAHIDFGVSGTLLTTDIHFQPTMVTNFLDERMDGDVTNPGGSHIMPAVYFVQPLSDRATFGFSLSVPFGLATDYGEDSVARYFATRSQVSVLNFNPAFAWRITPQLALGLGLDIQYLRAELNQAVDTASLFYLGYQQGIEKPLILENQGKSWGLGWNIGFYLEPNPTTRWGLSYRSSVTHKLHGFSRVKNLPQDPIFLDEAGFFGLRNSYITGNLTLPDSFTFSIKKVLSEKWSWLSDIAYIRWNRVRDISLHFYGTPSGVNPRYNFLPDQTIPFHYRNTWRLALGTMYQLTEKVLIRTGIAWDQTPIKSAYRLARIPDANHFWLSLGAGIQVTKRLDLNLALTRVIIPTVKLHQQVVSFLGNQELKAKFRGHADLLGLQLNYHWD